MSVMINQNSFLVVEEGALKGVKRVANCVAEDMAKVFGKKNPVCEGLENAEKDGTIIAATLGFTKLTEAGCSLDVSDIDGKREVYKYIADGNKLYIIGSDKRGTIYGLFHLSELLGVSPLVDWFKLNPAKKESVEIEACEMKASKEPSVRYRGFFINDEWPAFGNWCTRNFGGFNAKAYEQIFLLLLRMKGNYMWPAMWSAIFPNDGPGLLNEELADELGVVMGMSHHEPCLRQGEEYRYLRGKDSIYGDAWNFRTNEAGITRFWEDGLKRSGKFENVITVGMRGECDTAIMGKNATLKDNIDLLRDVLKTQNRLIRENVNANLDEVPRMLALYKEVEPYFYGDDETEGLMDSPELEGVTLMLCDDNYGNLRTVPTEHMRSHKGGYGMYYHFDYHGFPISFEWINSSYLPKVWEQMTQAYESGIRDLWIVNVGDLFTMEYPLAYFLELAYDYEKWGISNMDSAAQFNELFLKQCFGERVSAEVLAKMNTLLTGYTRIAHKRRPEAMNSEIYSAQWYGESDDLLAEIKKLEELADELRASLEEDLKFPYYALIYYPAKGNLNVQKLQLLTGKNHYYAGFSCNQANLLAKEVEECLAYDVALVEELHEAEEGRFYGMGLSEHIGFKHWCEEECQYPVLHTFKKGNKPRVIVSIPGTDQHTEGGFWTGKVLTLGDFLSPDKTEASIELLSAGAKGSYSISASASYLALSEESGNLDSDEKKLITVTLDRAAFETSTAPSPAEITVKTDIGTIKIVVPIAEKNCDEIASAFSTGTYIWLGEDILPENRYYPYQYIAMEADGYTALVSTEVTNSAGEKTEAVFKEIKDYGKTKSAMKAFPIDVVYDKENAPGITYTFEVKRDGDYVIEAFMNPSNAPFRDGHLYYGVSVNGGEISVENALPEGFLVGDHQQDWLKGVLDNIRVAGVTKRLKAGVNTVTFYALSPGFVLERVLVCEEGNKPAASYLGPKETYRV